MATETPIGTPLGTFNAAMLFHQWDQLRNLDSVVQGLETRRLDQQVTARKIDEAQTAGTRVCITAGSFIANGL